MSAPDFHFIRTGEHAPRTAAARVVFIVALLVVVAILGAVKARWWQDVLAVVLIWLVRLTSRREFQ
jgi:hypothetical protein